MPRFRGCLSGNELNPSSVVITGADAFSAKACSSAYALDRMIPCPAKMTGRFDCAISAAACDTACAVGGGVNVAKRLRYSSDVIWSEGRYDARADCISLGTSTRTGPGRPLRAIQNAWCITDASSSMLRTRKLCLVIG